MNIQNHKEQIGLSFLLDEAFDNYEVRETANKGVVMKADSTYYIAPTRYGYRLTVTKVFDRHVEVAKDMGMESEIRAFDGSMVIAINDIQEAIKFIDACESDLH